VLGEGGQVPELTKRGEVDHRGNRKNRSVRL
jgi:hypothetical protein